METAEPIKLTFYHIALMGAAVGLFLGLIPLILGFFKGRKALGAAGMIGSVAGGAFLGIFLSLPIIGACSWFILGKPFPKIVGGALIVLGVLIDLFGFLRADSIAARLTPAEGANGVKFLIIIYGLLFIGAGIAMLFSRSSKTDSQESAANLAHESD